MSGQTQSQERSRSDAWQPQTNSVNSSAARSEGSESNWSYEQRVVRRAAEQVRKFCEKYPDRAYLPLSETDGRSLRSAVVEKEFVTETIEPQQEWEQAHTVAQVDRAEPLLWKDALFEFLISRQQYDDGVVGSFSARESDATAEFSKEFNDCWTTAYGDKQAAKNKGAIRQLLGGQYPSDNPDSDCRGETEDGIWSDDIATVLLTRTASSIPGENRLPPADFADELTTWSDGGVYDVVRNICEYHLDLSSDQWGYVRGDDVHGLPSDDDDEHHQRGGENACYPHRHDGIYLDVSETDLRDQFETNSGVKSALQSLFYKAIRKHLESCAYAEPEAHQMEDAVEVMLEEVEHPGSYATGYLRLDEDEEMMDRSVEFQSFAAVEWATARKRIGRSQLFNDAAAADLCKQQSWTRHGAACEYDRSGHGESELVCSQCGSGIGIDAETLAEHRIADSDSEPAVSADGGEVVVGARVGESTDRARVRAAVSEFVDVHGEPESVIGMLGELGLPPLVDVAAEVVEGKEPPGAEPIRGRPPDPPSEFQLDSITTPDGDTNESPVPGSGGVEMATLVLPEQRLMDETRLRYIGDDRRPKIVLEDSNDRLSTYNPEIAAGWLVRHGYREPWHAELVMEFTHHGEDTADVLEDPVAQPPRHVRNE